MFRLYLHERSVAGLTNIGTPSVVTFVLGRGGGLETSLISLFSPVTRPLEEIATIRRIDLFAKPLGFPFVPPRSYRSR